jgi:hypothetical protein
LDFLQLPIHFQLREASADTFLLKQTSTSREVFTVKQYPLFLLFIKTIAMIVLAMVWQG